jgi:hypothetical protein
MSPGLQISLALLFDLPVWHDNFFDLVFETGTHYVVRLASNS